MSIHVTLALISRRFPAVLFVLLAGEPPPRLHSEQASVEKGSSLLLPRFRPQEEPKPTGRAEALLCPCGSSPSLTHSNLQPLPSLCSTLPTGTSPPPILATGHRVAPSLPDFSHSSLLSSFDACYRKNSHPCDFFYMNRTQHPLFDSVRSLPQCYPPIPSTGTRPSLVAKRNFSSKDVKTGKYEQSYVNPNHKAFHYFPTLDDIPLLGISKWGEVLVIPVAMKLQ